ncbi:unnamed protein product [marine sediment metagenome]|uniref:FAD-binding oxidoreductase/transferase type 4 C-terminal domain-containing protein n=1 Tax=marine sediment metagenome TaxID=412755 RepID=X1U6J7_9ZZZZ
MTFTKEAVSGLTAYVFGHAGDGNIHVVIMDRPDDNEQWKVVEEANSKIVIKALEFEGTCTGEHGVGIGKRKFMEAEHGRSLEMMRRIKMELLDPRGIMNPGKILP